MSRLVVLFLLFPVVAMAGEAHEAVHFDWHIHGWYIVDFLVGVGIMGWLLGPTMRTYFRERSERVKQALEEATKALEEAESGLEEYNRKLKNIQTEIDDLLAGYKARGEEEKSRAMHEAIAAAEAMKRQSRSRIELALAEMDARVRHDVVTGAIDLVVEGIQKQGGLAVSDALVNRFVKEIEQL